MEAGIAVATGRLRPPLHSEISDKVRVRDTLFWCMFTDMMLSLELAQPDWTLLVWSAKRQAKFWRYYGNAKEVWVRKNSKEEQIQ